MKRQEASPLLISLLSPRFWESAPVVFTAVGLSSPLFLHPAGFVLPGEPAIVLWFRVAFRAFALDELACCVVLHGWMLSRVVCHE